MLLDAKCFAVPSGGEIPTRQAVELPLTTRRLIALTYGLLAHSLFVLAVAAMMLGIFTGMQSGLGRLTGWSALVVDLILALQFPILHSFLLSSRGRRLLARLAPGGMGSDLGTTLYALVASVQLLAVFLLWSPSHAIWWSAQGQIRVLCWVGFGLAWSLLGRALYEAGLALQTGFLGWSAVWRGQKPAFGGFPTTGLFRFCRHPVYLAFAVTLWVSPVLTPERLLLATIWTAYCILGPLHKERRCVRCYGDAYRQYQARTSYWLPKW